jgi:membrane-associated phospholipid phosphatase
MHYPSDVVVGVLLGLALGATVPLPGPEAEAEYGPWGEER